MDTGTPTPAAPGTTTPAQPALAALRAASARVAQLGTPTGEPGPADDHAFDAADHAARFEDLHEALSAVLDELDRG